MHKPTCVRKRNCYFLKDFKTLISPAYLLSYSWLQLYAYTMPTCIVYQRFQPIGSTQFWGSKYNFVSRQKFKN